MENTPHKLKQTSVARIAIFTGVSLGIYFPIWYLNRTQDFNRLQSPEKLGKPIFVLSTVLFCIGILISLYSGVIESLNQIQNSHDLSVTFNALDLAANLIILTGLVPLVQQTFKIKKILTDHYHGYLKRDVTFSNLYTLLFLNFYLQHKINELNPTTH